MSSTRVFQNTGSARPGRSTFDLSYEKKLTCDMGQLIPVMCDEVIPGDVFHISNEIVVRFQPLVAPILHEVNVFTHYFFVPYRLLDDEWEDFITGGVDGLNASVLPRWNPTNYALGSLWDYLGFPPTILPPGMSAPMAYPKYAYNRIYNDYYRDQNLIAPLDVTINEDILIRAWEKDYFTSSLLFQQRGTAPALPMSGTVHATFNETLPGAGAVIGALMYPAVSTANSHPLNYDMTNGYPFSAMDKISQELGQAYIPLVNLNMNDIDLTGHAFNISELRLAFQMQRMLERNARAGARYTEWLKANYGVSPRDERLQRPEYIGGSRSPVIISEVLQTSMTVDPVGAVKGSPQGTMAGHGIAVDRQFAAKYRATEFGLIMGIMSIMPRAAYSQGINRQWLRRTKWDFFNVALQNLSEQAIEKEEIYLTNNETTNMGIFGYQGRFDEMRYKPNMVVGEMRNLLDYWHLAREFAAMPILNQSFIECVPDKRIFAVETVPGLIVSVANKIRATRPMSLSAEPGLIDHA
nr:MAG: major capsid protein [Microviridae sp.]